MKRLLPLVLALAGCKLAAPSTGQVIEPGVARAEFEVRVGATLSNGAHAYRPRLEAEGLLAQLGGHPESPPPTLSQQTIRQE